MSTRKINQLIVASLQRADGPVASDDALDIVIGCAMSVGWSNADLAGLNRKALAKRMQYLAVAGKLVVWGKKMDEHRRQTPLYAPPTGAIEPIPDPPPPPPEPAPAADATAERMLRSPVVAQKVQELLIAIGDELSAGRSRT